MNESSHGNNYEYAKSEADKVDEQIIETLQTGCSFRVEAGAGSGKTYSLIKLLNGFNPTNGLNTIVKSKM